MRMEALRRSFFVVSLGLSTLTGCSLFQAKPASQDNKPPQPKQKTSTEVVQKPAAKTKPVEDAEPDAEPQMSAIEQWAEQMAKRNESKESGGRKPATRTVLDGKRSSNANALF